MDCIELFMVPIINNQSQLIPTTHDNLNESLYDLLSKINNILDSNLYIRISSINNQIHQSFLATFKTQVLR